MKYYVYHVDEIDEENRIYLDLRRKRVFCDSMDTIVGTEPKVKELVTKMYFARFPFQDSWIEKAFQFFERKNMIESGKTQGGLKYVMIKDKVMKEIFFALHEKKEMLLLVLLKNEEEIKKNYLKFLEFLREGF